MTKKDYIAFAAMFKQELERIQISFAYSLDDVNECIHLARMTADIFAADNPRFDRSRFLKACGIEEGE